MAKNKNSSKNSNKKVLKNTTKVPNSNKATDNIASASCNSTTNTTNTTNNGNIENQGFNIDKLLNNKNLPPISAIFLGKFDVHTGYTLKWFKNLDNLNNNKNLLDGLEFKILPSGLHSIEKDTICFIQPKFPTISTISENLKNKNNNFDSEESNCYYGISVFRQNSAHLKTTNNANGTATINRNDVKMYSLGILIDPIHANSFYNSNLLNSVTWKPKLFSSCWNYNKILDELLVEFMENTDAIISSNYLNFGRFFENYKFMDLNNSNNKFKNIIKNVNYNRKKSISNINNSNESDKNLSLASSNTTSNITTNNSNTLNTTMATNSDHMILSLFKLIDDLGPSIFTIWKLALLRKKLILYAEAPPSSVELYSSTPTSTTSTGETDNKHNNGHIENPDDDYDDDSYHPKISDFSKFVYDISLLSSVPQEIKLSLLKSGISERKLNDLEILKPIYNLCVNDIDYLKKLDEGSHFIGSTTDQIILDKSSLYDYAVKIPSHYKKPNYQPSSVTDTPQAHSSTSVSSPSSLVTADYDANADSNVDGFNNKSSKSKSPSSNSSLSSSTFVPSSGGDSVYSLSSSQSNDKLELDVPLILESKNFRNSLAKSSVKSSQRDMKRFLLLFHSIFDNFNSSKFNKKSKNIIKPSKPHYRDDISEENDTLESNVEAPLLPSLTTSSSTALLNIDDSNDDDGHGFIGGGDDSADYYEASELQEQNEQLMNYYKAITEPMSIREFIWKGFSWWATAGSDGNDEDVLEYDRILLGNLILKNSNGANMNEADSKVENVLLLVGYFQSLTVKIFSMLIDLINNNESAKDIGSRDKQRHQQGDESNNSLFFDSADEGEALLSHGNSANETRSHSDDTICIEHRDIYEMGLDPYSEFDVFFLTELVDLWWGKKVKIGTYLGNLCCI